MKKYLRALYLLPVLLIAFSTTIAKAEDLIVGEDDDPNAPVTYITLKWDPNRERDLAGYNVYYGLASGDYTYLKTVDDPTVLLGVRGSKRVYFAVTAFNTSREESVFSDEVHWP